MKGARDLLRLDAAVFLSGAALMALEIVGSRVLAPVFGTSLFVWGALITTFLAALAVGYALGGRLADRRPQPELLSAVLLAAGALVIVLFAAPDAVLAAASGAPVPDRFRALLAAAVLFAPPSILMGAVTPFAVRLAAKDLALVGSAAGRLSAVSTVGSILGAFAAAFFLIPTFPTRPIIFGIGAALLVSALLVPASRFPRRAAWACFLGCAGALVFLVGPGFAKAPGPAGTLLLEKETAYHRIRVVDQGLRRALYFDNRLQGYAPVRPGLELGIAYTDGLALFSLAFVPNARRVVMIGLGAGMLPNLLAARAPEIASTSIEIDPEVVAVARKYFAFVPDANDRVIVGDGRREMDRQVDGADVILVDAYFSDSLPFHLVTKEFDELCARKLGDDGVLAVNFGGDLTGARNRLFWAAVRTLAEVFPRVYIFSNELKAGAATFRGNAIVVATRSPERLDPGTLADRAKGAAERLGRPAISEWAARLYEGELRIADVPVLTDAYSPTDALQHLAR
ncbi:MAG: fused MFS/spermidine synthase [Acidobacteriota bacterium]